MRTLTAFFFCFQLTGCGTLLAVADGVGTVAVYGVKTVINTVDTITLISSTETTEEPVCDS
jgi:hypothetical protein